MIDQEKITNLLIQICSNKNTFSIENIKKADFIRISTKGSIFLTDEDNEKFFEIIQELNKDKYISYNFGPEYLKDKIFEIIVSTVETNENELQKEIEDKINDLYQNLHEQIKEHLFIFPIENLTVKRKFRVGDVSFYPYSKTRKKHIRSKIWTIIKNNPHYNRTEKIKIINRMINDFERNVKNIQLSLAEVTLYGCKGPVEQVALRKIRMALYSLKLYSYPLDDSHQRYFGIVGEIIRGIVRSSFDFVREDSQQSNTIVGYLAPFEIDKKRKEFMRTFEFQTLNKILSKTEFNDFEQHLLTAIFWVGYALNIPIFYDQIEKHQRKKKGYENIEYFNLNQRFFYLFISLESLLKIQYEKQYTKKVIQRISKLITDKIDEREEVTQKLEEYYKIRGEIAHQGVEFVTLKQLLDLTLIAQFCIFNTLKLLRNKSFEEHSRFIQYIED